MIKERAFSGELAFLSNFYPCSVKGPEGYIYRSVEHAYQLSKLEQVTSGVFEMTDVMTAGEVKKFGKKINIRDDWDSIKLGVMQDLLRKKFAIPELRRKLLDTGETELVETNWWGDTFWGVCNGKGENYLGKLLMKIRKEINTVDSGVSI